MVASSLKDEASVPVATQSPRGHHVNEDCSCAFYSNECAKSSYLWNCGYDSDCYSVEWDAKDAPSRYLPDGICFLQLEAGGYRATVNTVLVR